MFKKSKRKIVAAIMFILICLFLGTLAIIYIASYFEVSNANFARLEHHAEMYVLTDHMNEDGLQDIPSGWMEPLPGVKPGRQFANDPSFRLATFYSVAISDNGQIIATDTGDRETYDEATLERYADDILKSDKKRGIKDRLVYLVEPKNEYTLIAFMDNTVIQDSMSTLFRYTLIFGSVALGALFFLARYLAKRIVDPLEQSYLKQKQFISDAGHELKTPVSVVSANAELLSREIGENQWLQNIRYENNRMSKLVTQLLDLARTENVKLQMEHIDLSRLVDGEALPFESVAFEAGFRLNENIVPGLQINGNSTQLKQLVSILLDNAIRHGKGGQDIWLSLKKEHGYAVLSVINVGREIPAEQREKLFERFYRADQARNDEDKHYGLGLAVAKSIVEAHNGKIEVRCFNNLVEFRVQVPAL